jgi:WD40 repeat protein
MINFDDNNSTDPGSLLAVAVNREGNRLALGHEDGTIQILDVGAGQEVDSISGSPRIAWSMAWSPDGSRLAWGNSIWDVATGEKLTTLSQDATIDSLAWSPDGKLLTSGARDATRIWDAVTGHEVGMIGGHARSISWSATGQRLATSDGSAVKVWDMRHAEQPYLRHGTDVVTSIAWSRDGQHLASASLDNVVKIWEVSTGTETSVIREHAAVDSVCWSPDGRRLAVGCRDGSANIWDIARSSRLHSLSGPGREINTVAWSPHGKWLAAAGRPGLICIWDANTGQARHTVNGDERQVNSVAWNANGTHLATAGEASNRIKIWEPGTWQETHSIAGPLPGVPFSHLRAVAWSPDDARLLILADEKIGIWNAEKADIDFWISGHSGGNQAIAWSPDGRRFVSSGADRTVKIWHTVTGQEIISLVADTSDVRSLAWSPDGHQLALGGADGKIRIWDASQGFEFAESSDYRLDMAERAAVMSP